LGGIVIAQPCYKHAYSKINYTQNNSDSQNVGKPESKLVLVPRYVAIVIIGNAQIEQDVEYKREIEQSKIESVLLCPHNVLNATVDAKNPKRLNQKVQRYQENKIDYKFAFQDVCLLPRESTKVFIIGN